MADMPRRIGRWRIESTLGSGGMGAVYLGRSGAGRAAIKVIHPGFAQNPHFRDRFRREVAISRLVDGPHVADVLDADVDASVPWLASQYVEGPTLAQQVTEAEPLDEARSMAVALALASALRDIHGAGVVHRDLKPANVILTSAGPVVIDFGIAAAADATSLTGTGMVVGSAGWMAPEQLRGDDVGPAADVFSWAATVCFAATGRSPFGNGRAEAVSYRVAHETPDLDGLPADLAPMVVPALAKDPTDRPTVAELIEHLSPAIAGAPTIAAGVTAIWSDGAPVAAPVPTPAPRGPRRSRAALVAVAVVVLLAVGLAGFVALRGDGDEDVAAVGSGSEDGPSSTMDPGSAFAPGTLPATVPPPTTSAPAPETSPTTAPTTEAPPPTEPPAPATPELSVQLDPTSDEDITSFTDFVFAHEQETVQLNVRWDDPLEPGQLDAKPEDEPAYLFVQGSCPTGDPPLCGSGMEILISDLGAVDDANMYFEHGQWVISGRFAVQGFGYHMGVTSVGLRAMPVE